MQESGNLLGASIYKAKAEQQNLAQRGMAFVAVMGAEQASCQKYLGRKNPVV